MNNSNIIIIVIVIVIIANLTVEAESYRKESMQAAITKSKASNNYSNIFPSLYYINIIIFF